MNIFSELFSLFVKPSPKGNTMSDPTQLTLGQAIDAKLAAAREKVAAIEAAVNADLDAAKAEVNRIELKAASIPEEFKALVHDDLIAKIEELFK